MLKLWIISGAVLLSASAAQASTSKRKPASGVPVPGAIVQHSLDCDIPSKDGEHILGVGYAMTCDTQALAPQYSVRGCALSRHAVSPNAKPFPIGLKEKSQEARHAEYDGAGLEVSLDNKTMKATVSFGDGSTMVCEEK
ncbi:MAG: hypothetical protein ACXWP1_03270 [Bdellovibrionota bacterium]